MKFIFAYEKLLNHYQQQEEIARRDYYDAVGKLDLEKLKYQAQWDLHDEAVAEIYDLRLQPKGAPAGRLVQLDSFIDGQKIRIERQRQVVINHTSIVEQKQEVLIFAVKEKKTLEKLKEKKLFEFKREEVKKERKVNDELVVTRFKRREGA